MPDNNETTVDPWQEETKGFYTPGAEPAPEADASDEQPAPVDDKTAPAAAADGEQDGETVAADPDPDADAAAAIEGRSGDLPDWMKKRLERANKKESAAEQRARVAEEKAQQALDELAALKAGNSKPAATEPPDPDDFDTTADYDAAKAAWTEAQKPKAKEEPKAETPKLNLPPGTSPEEYGGIEASLKMAITADTKAAILKMPVFTETMIVSIFDIADGDAGEMENVAKFVADNADLMGEIAKMPLRRQQATIERAYSERVVSATPKPKGDEAPPPISRNKARPAATGYSPDFSEFERQRNEEERRKGPF